MNHILTSKNEHIGTNTNPCILNFALNQDVESNWASNLNKLKLPIKRTRTWKLFQNLNQLAKSLFPSDWKSETWKF